MRLFIAIELPSEIKEELSKTQAKIRKNPAQLTTVRAENLHLTLKFLGEVDERKAIRVRESLRTISFSPFTATLSCIGVFPSESYIRVVWAGLESKDGIMALQKQIEERMNAIGFKPEKDFTPHLTICRVLSVNDKGTFIESVKDIAVEKKAFTISSFGLIKSTLTKDGPLYEVIEEFKHA